ncbi:MAG: mannosyl-3-phosphoglycerate phosphatase [Candidatus Zixiibacteriota bacterium]
MISLSQRRTTTKPAAKKKKRTPPPPKPGLVVFTDLDGTLLDFHTYSFKPATAALRELKRLNIPLVLVSSKTRAEMEVISKAIGHEGPIISENGSAIFWPKSITRTRPKGAKANNGYWVRELGKPYDAVRKRLVEFREQSGVGCEGFGDWTPDQITRLAGIPIASAPLAKQREYDEPFIFKPSLSESEEEQYIKKLSGGGFTVTRGGRFLHLTGPSDKGKAVRELIAWYSKKAPVKPRTLAFGDSPNDWPMMAACDIAVAVKRPDGKYHASLREHKGIRLAGAPGPEGFNRMVLRLLKQLL